MSTLLFLIVLTPRTSSFQVWPNTPGDELPWRGGGLLSEALGVNPPPSTAPAVLCARLRQAQEELGGCSPSFPCSIRPWNCLGRRGRGRGQGTSASRGSPSTQVWSGPLVRNGACYCHPSPNPQPQSPGAGVGASRHG